MRTTQLKSDSSDALERTRRAFGRDIELMRGAQARLFPRRLPQLETLSYAGVCLEAHEVGGDYYDFFATGPGRLGVAVADVTGNGLGAALHMANLHGVIRSQFRETSRDLRDAAMLAHQICLECWPESTYASLFLAEYDDRTRLLRYVNCGHPAALLIHSGGAIEPLAATASVLGLFEEWMCSASEVPLVPGDTLLIYSDGLLEARDAEGAEFGRARVEKLLRAGADLPVSLLLESIVDGVASECGPDQDDLTLVALRSGTWHDGPSPISRREGRSGAGTRMADL